MYISVKINNKYPNAFALQSSLRDLIQKRIDLLSEKEIKEAYLKRIKELFFEKIWADINAFYDKDKQPIKTNTKCIEESINYGAKEIVDYINKMHLENLALFRLITEGILMPVDVCNSKRNICFNVGNINVYVIIDGLPYSKFILVKRLESI